MIMKTLKIIDAFNERYIKYVIGECTGVCTIGDKVKFTFFDREYFSLLAYFDDDELCIENTRGESIFDYAEESGFSDWDILCIKFGEEKAAEYIRKNDALNVMKNAMWRLREAWLECRNSLYTTKFDCNDYIAEDYPFDKSFDEMDVSKWVVSVVEKINRDLK